MPIEDLVDRIIRDAENKSGEYRQKAGTEAEKILSEASRESDAVFDKQFSSLKKDAEEEKRQRITMAQMEARKDLLEEKQKLIDQVFKLTLEKLLNLPEEEYLGILIRLLTENPPDEGGEIILSGSDRERLGDKLVQAANEKIKTAGGRARFTLSGETRDVKGGFIIKTGGVEINNGFKVQLDSRREEFEPFLVKILFGEGQR